MKPISLVLALAAALVLSLAPVASAHAEYLRSEPDRGARLDVAPREVLVVLSERVDASGSGIEVVDADGNRVHEGEVRLANGPQPEFRASLPADLADGAYQIRWWAFSTVDQHTTSGVIGFAVGGFEPPASQQSSADTVDPGAALARAIQYAGFALVFGALGFRRFVLRGGASDSLVEITGRVFAAGAVLHAGGLVGLVANTHGNSGLDLGHFVASEVGQIMVLRVAAGLVLLALAVWAWRTDAGAAWLLAAMFALAAAAGSARFGHASQKGLGAIAIDGLHLVAVSTWTGGLALLLWTIRHASRYGWDARGVRDVGVRFSRVALTAVIVLVLTGLAASVAILGAPSTSTLEQAWDSSWGRALAAKIALSLAMVGLAAANRYVFLDHPDWRGPPFVKAVQRWIHGATDGRAGRLFDAQPSEAPRRVRSFGRVVTVEATLGAAVIVLAGLLTSVGAPYTGTAAAASDDALRLTAEGDEFVGTLYLDPAPTRGSFSHPRVYLADADGQPMEDNTCGRQDCLHLYVSQANGSEGEEPHTLVPEGGGWWTSEDLLFVAAGPTRLRVEVQTAYVYLDELVFEFDVA